MDCRFVVSVATLEYSAGTNHVDCSPVSVLPDCNVQFVALVLYSIIHNVVCTRLATCRVPQSSRLT